MALWPSEYNKNNCTKFDIEILNPFQKAKEQKQVMIHKMVKKKSKTAYLRRVTSMNLFCVYATTWKTPKKYLQSFRGSRTCKQIYNLIDQLIWNWECIHIPMHIQKNTHARIPKGSFKEREHIEQIYTCNYSSY